MNDPAERDKWVSAAGHGKPGSDKYDKEAAAKIAQTDAAMLQPLLEHTNAYLTGDAQQAGDRHRRAQQPVLQYHWNRYAVDNCAKTASELRRYGLRD